jgi:hypothetical protein
MYDDIRAIRARLEQHCLNFGIYRRDAADKKKKAIIDSLTIGVINAELSLSDLERCINDVEPDVVLDLNFFNDGGNLFDTYIQVAEWRHFAKELFSQICSGLGTPNAASGNGELMFLFMSKHVKKPTQGDVLVNDEKIELKGDQTRVMGRIGGIEFNAKALILSQSYGVLVPNKATRSNIDAVELEKREHEQHWNVELGKLDLSIQKEFVNKWLGIIDGNNHTASVNKIFEQGMFDRIELVKEIIKILFADMVDHQNFDKFIIQGDGSNAKVCLKDKDEFDAKIDSGAIIPDKDYFRVNQSYNVGWYIS